MFGGFRVRQAAQQNIATVTGASLVWDTLIEDVGGFWTGAFNCKVPQDGAGVYALCASAMVKATAQGWVYMTVATWRGGLNASNIRAGIWVPADATIEPTVTAYGITRCQANDSLIVTIQNQTGAQISIGNVVGFFSEFSGIFLGS